jgi:hypothetical protein
MKKSSGIFNFMLNFNKSQSLIYTKSKLFENTWKKFLSNFQPQILCQRLEKRI